MPKGEKRQKQANGHFQLSKEVVCRADEFCTFTCMFSILNTPAVTRSHKHTHQQIDSQELTDVLLFLLLYERHYP